jgi:hypothetical protein
MLEKNNLQIAAWIDDWIHKKIEARSHAPATASR